MRARACLLLVLLPALALAAKSSAAPRAPVTLSHGRQAPAPYPQQHEGHTPSAEAPRLSVAVDGSSTPDLIPDELAYSHFLRAMAASVSAAGRQVALRQAGLAPGDGAAFAAALGTLGTELDDIARQRRAGGPSLPTAAREQLKQLEAAVVEGARVRVDLALTAAGRASLDAHVRTHVKHRIKIYRGPVMPPPPGGVIQ